MAPFNNSKKNGAVASAAAAGLAAAWFSFYPITGDNPFCPQFIGSAEILRLKARPGPKARIESEEFKEMIFDNATRNCPASDYIFFASEGQDSKKIIAEEPFIKPLQDFDYLEASRVKTCGKYLEQLVNSGKLKFFVRHGGSKAAERSFPQYRKVIEDDKNPDPKFAGYWAHEVTHADFPAGHGLTGKGIRIGILDSGLYPNVPQFKGQVKQFIDFVYHGSYASTNDGHGTFVTGIINKVVPEADIYMYRIHDAEGLNLMTDVLEAFNQVIADKLDVINNSWGLSELRELEGMSWDDGNKVLAEALERVAKKGTVIVASAGNDSYYGPFTKEQLPNGSPYAISVGATDIRGEIAEFSDLDAHFFAPGDLVYSTVDAQKHTFWSGTSFSGPFGTAAVAVVQDYAKQHNLNFNYRQIRSIIEFSCRMESSTIVAPNGRSETYFFKSLDYEELVQHMESIFPDK